MLIFPVRHHSPAAALHLDRLIRDVRPGAILIEGPEDANSLIPLLVDPLTVPPVAIYAFEGERSGDVAHYRSVFYPFCAYSPEYVALRAGAETGARIAFCDVPTWASLLASEHSGLAPDPAEDAYGRFAGRLAEVAGFPSFDAFWEAAVEQVCAQAPVDEYIAALTDFGAKARDVASLHRAALTDLARERHMAAVAVEMVASGVPAEKIMIVCGAAHAVPIAEAIAAGATRPELGNPVPVELALVPYSYPRLSDDHGYGAGNRAPWYYQAVWEEGGDFLAASRRALLTVASRLRDQGRLASLAQVIDADELAIVLARLRGKRAPGVDEVSDAAVACLAQGQPAVVERVLRETLVGDRLGQVTPRAGLTPLQAEFYDTTARLRLPVQDASRTILVHLPDPVEAAQSVFLHRLVAAGVPFARQLEGGIGGSVAARGGALAGLRRAREKWELCWSPLTDACLIERNAWGSTLAGVAERLLLKRIESAGAIDEGAEILLHLALCDLPAAFARALRRCETLAADNASFPAIARAAFHLDALLALGAARQLPEPELADLASRLFVRAALHLPAASQCGDDAALEIETSLIPLAELVRKGSPIAAADLFWDAVCTVSELDSAHPGLRGLALVLLEIGNRLAPGDLTLRLQRQLVGTSPDAGARLVAGLFRLHRSTLIRHRALIGAITDFLLNVEIESLIPLLPALRRTLGNLSPAERAYLQETLARLFGVTQDASLPANVPDRLQARLRAADAAVAAVLTTWREHYGIA